MFLGSFSYFRCLGRFSCFGCFGCVPGLLVFMQVGHADILQVLELLVVVNFSCARSADFFADLAHIDLLVQCTRSADL